MNKRTQELIRNGVKVAGKIGKKIFIEGTKAAAAGALIVGMEKFYRGGFPELKATSADEFLELEEGEDDYV